MVHFQRLWWLILVLFTLHGGGEDLNTMAKKEEPTMDFKMSVWHLRHLAKTEFILADILDRWRNSEKNEEKIQALIQRYYIHGLLIH